MRKKKNRKNQGSTGELRQRWKGADIKAGYLQRNDQDWVNQVVPFINTGKTRKAVEAESMNHVNTQ
jgi:hypothetical protein